MNEVFLLLGGNIGDKKQLFQKALQLLQNELGEVANESAVYETEPWGFETEEMFWNLAIEIKTKKEPYQVLKTTQQIEKELGRERKKEEYESRPMDIDIIFYNEQILNSEDLIIPHPRIAERKFVLEPLAELIPEFVHPVHHLKVEELLKRCKDKLLVKRLRKLEEI